MKDSVGNKMELTSSRSVVLSYDGLQASLQNSCHEYSVDSDRSLSNFKPSQYVSFDKLRNCSIPYMTKVSIVPPKMIMGKMYDELTLETGRRPKEDDVDGHLFPTKRGRVVGVVGEGDCEVIEFVREIKGNQDYGNHCGMKEFVWGIEDKNRNDGDDDVVKIISDSKRIYSGWSNAVPLI
ncbi:hypothetical protein ACH5RR_023686 [Cinchona calisaya]|uniref:Uncharacterized protein n=1 Tax=Cinchona calisaya TaxID=153742 RepID=A0ABD2ZCG3_9GENT